METPKAKLRFSAGALSVALLTGAACSRTAGNGIGHGTTTLSIGIAAPEGGLDPGIRVAASLISQEHLVTLGYDGRTGPNIVARWNRSDDGLVWRFELQDGVTFHDGTAVTGGGVSEILRAALRDPSRVALAPSFQQISSVEADGPTAFVVNLTRPSPLFLGDLAVFSLTHGSGDRTVGTGPFIVESRDDKRIVMRRFDHYREGTPAINRLELNAFPTVRNAWTALMRGEVDFLFEVGADAAEFVGGESSVQTFTFLRPYTLMLGFNLRHPVLRSPEIRRALNQAIDRDAIVRAGFRGRARPAQDPIWPYHWTSTTGGPTYTHNREAAARAFTAAGYREAKSVDGRMPSRFQLKCLVYRPLERVALIVQKQLFEVGIDMQIELEGAGEIAARAARGDYEAFLFWQVTGRSLTFPYLFWHSPEPGRPVLLQSGYSSADAALDRVRYAPNDDDLRHAVAELQRVMHDDPPAAFLAWEERVRAVSRKFHVPTPEPGRDVIASLWRWRPAEVNAARTQ
jgi:peptide/nickel transport system substrate-binding protein